MTVHVEQVTFSYRRLPALFDVSAQAESGRITAVIGPNAAGKSTLLKCVIGALRPQRGRVNVNGLDVHAMRPRQLAREIAYVPQRSAVAATFTVQQVVELGRYALPPSPGKVVDAIERLDLQGLEHRRYNELSVGQQQRVTVGRAVAQLSENGCLVLDEPASAMDLRHVVLCMRLLREIARNGATVVIAMHDLSLAAAVADDIWLMDGGRMVAVGTTADVMQPSQLQQVFGVGFQWVDLPHARRLLPEHDAAASPIDATMIA